MSYLMTCRDVCQSEICAYLPDYLQAAKVTLSEYRFEKNV